MDILKALASIQSERISETSLERVRKHIIATYPEFLTWLTRKKWAEDEFIYLCDGLNPNNFKSFLHWDNGRIFLSFYQKIYLPHFKKMRELIRVSKHNKQLPKGGKSPELWMKWALGNGLVISEELKRAFQVTSLKNKNSEDLSTREIDSLLKLVIGMAIRGYNYDPKVSRNNSTGDIQKDLEFLKIPLHQNTILKWLKEASLLIGP